MKIFFFGRRVFVLALLVLALFVAPLRVTGAGRLEAKPGEELRVTGYELIGTVNFPTGTIFEGTEVGGLSSITFDKWRGVYYALSDDQSQINPARFYTLDINLDDGQLDPGDITFLEVTTLLDENRQPYAPGSLDLEGLVMPKPGFLLISTEGSSLAVPPVNPFINFYNLQGKFTREMPVPDKYLPIPDVQGVRFNYGFESLNVSPDRRYLYTANEGALVQDGPAADVGVPSNARILQYSLSQRELLHEYVYPVNPVPDVPVPPTAFRVNGVVELLPLDNFGTMLVMERAFSVGVGNTVHLYQISTQGATDVSGFFALPATYTPVEKQFLLDVETDLGIIPDNLEGMVFGPPLPDGRLPLILVSDNNFDPAAVTQFIVLAVALEPVDN